MKWLHIKAHNARLFFYCKIDEQIDHDILSKRILRQMMLKMAGAHTFHYTNEVMKEYYNQWHKDLIDSIDSSINGGFYRIDDYYHTKKNGDKVYFKEYHNGIKLVADDNSVSSTTKCNVSGYNFESSGSVSWHSIAKMRGVSEELYDSFRDMLEIIVGRIDKRSLDSVLRECLREREIRYNFVCSVIDKFIEDHEAEIKKVTYFRRLLEFIKNPKSVLNSRGNVDIRTQMGMRHIQFAEQKYSININCEMYIPVSDWLFEFMDKYYSGCSLFDGGIVSIEEIISEDNFNHSCHNGFKEMSLLKENPIYNIKKDEPKTENNNETEINVHESE